MSTLNADDTVFYSLGRDSIPYGTDRDFVEDEAQAIRGSGDVKETTAEKLRSYIERDTRDAYPVHCDPLTA